MDNWIYIQEPGRVIAGRLQIFKQLESCGWSAILQKSGSAWNISGNENDPLWIRSDEELKRLAAQELAKIGIIQESAVFDSMVLRVPKAYPAYFGTYGRFDEIREYLDKFENLFLIGRNGMHRYNKSGSP